MSKAGIERVIVILTLAVRDKNLTYVYELT